MMMRYMVKRKNVTIYDIAKEAQVSPATVSRILTSNANVSSDKRQRVQQVIDKYNFRPNALAKGLSNSKRKVIGMITADIRNPFYAQLFVACEIAADKRGYTLLVCDGFSTRNLEEKQLDKLASQRVDAIIQIGGAVDEPISDLKYVEGINRIANDIPIIINGKLDGADCYQVNIDHCQGIELAIEHLVELGHQEIALIGGCTSVKSSIDKKQKFLQMMKRYMLESPDEFVVLNGDYNQSSGYESMKKILQAGHIPTGVIAINDLTALGIMSAIIEAGLSIPNDISVIGADNSNFVEATSPRLTSIDYDYSLVGEKIIETAVNAIDNIGQPRIQETKVNLVIRESTGKCKYNS